MKYIVTGITSVIFEEILRFILNSSLNLINMDKTFFITIPISVFSLCILWIYLWVNDRIKKSDLFFEISNTILTRKIKHTYKCLTSNKILPISNLLTDLEIKLYNELDVKYKTKIDELLKDIPK